jgi:hypothetical protein
MNNETSIKPSRPDVISVSSLSLKAHLESLADRTPPPPYPPLRWTILLLSLPAFALGVTFAAKTAGKTTDSQIDSAGAVDNIEGLVQANPSVW